MRAFIKGTAIAGGSLLLLLLTTLAGVAIFPRQLTEYALEKVLAREVTIGGAFDVDWGRIVRVHAGDVSVSNVGWAKAPAFFKTQVLDLAIDLPALIDGEIILPLVHLAGLELNLARSARSKVNWEFGEKGQDPQQPTAAPIIFAIAKLTVDNGSVVFRDLELGTEVATFIDSLQGRITPTAVELHGLGEFERNPLAFDFAADGTGALYGPRPYEIELALKSGTTAARIAGTLAHPGNMTELDVALTLAGEDLHELAELTGLPLPETASFHVEGALRQDGKVWHLSDFDGHIGDSDLHGNLTLDLSGPRPMLAADLVSNRLDSELLLALTDAAPEDDRETVQTPQALSGLSKLHVLDARVQFVAHEILSTEMPIDEVSVQLTLEDGLLVVDPIEVELTEGALSGEIRLDASGEQPSGKIALAFDQVALAPIVALAKSDYPISGTVDGELALVFAGGSIEIANGQLDYRAPDLDTDLRLTLARVDAEPVDLLKISAQGTFRGVPAKGTAVGAPLTLLFASENAYPVRFEVHIAQTEAAASGTITAFGSAKGTRGVIDGQGSLSFQGTNFAQLLGELDGDATLSMSEGQLNALLVELAGIDGGESLLAWLQEGVQLVPLRCAFADLEARDGIVYVERLVLDSTDTKFNMDGQVNLKDETLDLSIKAHPKDVSFFVARAPLLLEGTFKDPEFRVARAGLIARGLAAALGIIAPPAALLALFEPGVGDNAPCDQLVQNFAAGGADNASVP